MPNTQDATLSVAVIIPCYKVSAHVLGLIGRIGSEVTAIYAVDDRCPEQTGDLIEAECADPRVTVLRNAVNKGVGGAVMAGYAKAIEDGHDVLVKLDGDGQMDPALIPNFVSPIESGHADYTKGNRFYSARALHQMPRVRLIGNAGLSFMTKASSGYWDVLDPTNGYTAIHARVADSIEFDRVSERYFFESDMLYNLGLLRAVVVDVPIVSLYAEEESNLSVLGSLGTFFGRNVANTAKRIVYSYFLRGFSVASLGLVLGILLTLTAAIFGGYYWILSAVTGVPSQTGTIVLAALLLIFGFQLLLLFVSNDIASTPRTPIHGLLRYVPRRALEQAAQAKALPVRLVEQTSEEKNRSEAS